MPCSFYAVEHDPEQPAVRVFDSRDAIRTCCRGVAAALATGTTPINRLGQQQESLTGRTRDESMTTYS